MQKAVKDMEAQRTLTIKRSEEPSTYNWENLAITTTVQSIRKVGVMIVLGILLFIAYKYQFAMYVADKKVDKFEIIDCKHFENEIIASADAEKSSISLQKRAYKAWFRHFRSDK